MDKSGTIYTVPLSNKPYRQLYSPQQKMSSHAESVGVLAMHARLPPYHGVFALDKDQHYNKTLCQRPMHRHA